MLRLRSRAQFQAVLAGQRLGASAHFVLHHCALPVTVTPGESGAADPAALFQPVSVWMGAMVPKRWAKRAVTRNAIKRQIYNVSLQFEDDLPAAAYLVRLRAGFDARIHESAVSVSLKQAVRLELMNLFATAFPAPTASPSTARA